MSSCVRFPLKPTRGKIIKKNNNKNNNSTNNIIIMIINKSIKTKIHTHTNTKNITIITIHNIFISAGR